MYHSFLLVDGEYRSLNIPLRPENRKELEERVRKYQTIESITVWNRYVLDQYETYDLCLKYHRICPADARTFSSRYHALAWICRKQLLRSDLNRSARIWLLYRLYKAEQSIAKSARAKEYFQYRQLSPSSHDSGPIPDTDRYPRILLQLAHEFGLHPDTLTRYFVFGKRLDQLEQISPGVRIRILTGNLEVCQAHMKALMEMPRSQLKEMIENPRCKKLIPPEITADKPAEPPRHRQPRIRLETAIKQTPTFDPDAVLNGLSYTVSAWKRTIVQTMAKATINTATVNGKEHLRLALDDLTQEISKLTLQLEGKTDE